MGTWIPPQLYIFIALILLAACSESGSPVKPPPPPPVIDTTTHNWRFEVDTLGENYSGIREVIALSATDAWVTGDIEYQLHNGDWRRYALAHWDGAKWTRKYMTRPNTNLPEDGNTLFGFSSNDIWMDGIYLYRYNGQEWREISINNPQIQGIESQMWGTSSTDMYFVGYGGNFNHYDGTAFRNIPTGTDIRLDDIWGDGGRIYIAGCTLDGTRSIVMKYENSVLTVLDTTETPGEFQFESVWYSAKDSVLGFAGYPNHIRIGDSIIAPQFSDYEVPFCHKVRGTGKNNIWIVGGFTCVMHYNGSTWKHYPELQKYGAVNIYSLDAHEDYFFAAGDVVHGGAYRGIVIRGYKVK